MPALRTVPRKRPRQERSRATADALLTATARVLRRHGFDRASTNRIAEEAGVSIGSLYQYFPSKEALVAALAERHVEEMTAVVEGSLAELATAPLEDTVRTLVGVMVRAHAVDPALHRILAEQVPRIGRMAKVREVERRIATLARGYLETRRSELRPLDLDLAALLAVQTVEALTHAAVIDEPQAMRGREAALIEEITQMIVRYLAKRPESGG